MPDLALLFAFWAAFGLALLSPGPNFAVLLGAALADGRAAALRLALGMVIGEILWGLAAVFGVAALAAQDARVETVLRIGGGLYLLYLAALSVRSALRQANAAEPAAAAPSAGAGIMRGFLIMLLNAKAGVFWVSLAGLFMRADQPASLGLLAVAGAVVMSAAYHGFLAVALATGVMRRFYARARRGIEATLGLVLGAIGIRLILN